MSGYYIDLRGVSGDLNDYIKKFLDGKNEIDFDIYDSEYLFDSGVDNFIMFDMRLDYGIFFCEFEETCTGFGFEKLTQNITTAKEVVENIIQSVYGI